MTGVLVSARLGLLATAVVVLTAVARAQDVLVIVLDDVGWPDVHPHVPAPNIERLARQGLVFDRAYSMPVCSITRYCLLFGRYPRRDGIGDYCPGHLEPSDSPTPPRGLSSLARLLSANGWSSALVGKWHLGQAGLLGAFADRQELGPFVHGFDRWLAGSPTSVAIGDDIAGTGHYFWRRVDDGRSTIETCYATSAQTDAFLRWWTSESSPKLGWLAFDAAHRPYEDPPLELLPPDYLVEPSDRGRYEAMIVALDAELGRVLAAVDLASTFVLLMADNGTPGDALPPDAEKGKAKDTTYERGVRVPLVVAGPGILPGTTSRLVHAVDVPSTLAELLGLLPPRRGFDDSVSFADELSRGFEGAPPRRFVFVERYQSRGSYRDDQAIVEERWKLQVTDPDGAARPRPAVERVFDLVEDPGEERPVAAVGAAVLARLRAELASIPPRAVDADAAGRRRR